MRAWFERTIGAGRAAQPTDRGFPSRASLVDVATLAAPIREAVAYYNAACFDFGRAWAHREVDGDHSFIFVHVGTDGDEGALEVYSVDGALLDAALLDGTTVTWRPRNVVRERFPPPED